MNVAPTGFVPQPADLLDLLLDEPERKPAEGHHAEPAGLGHRGGQGRRRHPGHARELDGMPAPHQLAEAVAAHGATSAEPELMASQLERGSPAERVDVDAGHPDSPSRLRRSPAGRRGTRSRLGSRPSAVAAARKASGSGLRAPMSVESTKASRSANSGRARNQSGPLIE